ncbi:MAG TPA: hypothetical protein VG457_12080 [Planctomycetota bacterium]|jgi:hypothetical protein|nr:hypothetical protein [Planctomycetota bacterium]
MIDEMDARLSDWVKGSLGKEKAELLFGIPKDAPKATTVTLSLVGVLPTPSPRTPQRPPLKLVLRYLVSVQAEDVEDAHRLLGTLAFSAMEIPDFELETEAPEAALWKAIGTPLQPSFAIRVPLLKIRPEPKARRVRFPLVIKTSAVRSLSGVVLGPGEIPIMGARVEIAGSGRPVETDSLGHFVIPGILREFAPRALEVRAKGARETIPLDPQAGADEDLVIHLNSLED